MDIRNQAGAFPVEHFAPQDGIMPLTRRLGALLGADPAPAIQPIEKTLARPGRKDLWTPEALAEMDRIYEEKPYV